MRYVNETVFSAGHLLHLDADGAERLAISVKGTWKLTGRNGAPVAQPAPPLRMVEQYAGEPGSSSLLREADIGLPKPGTDVLLAGSAFTSGGRGVSVEVGISVGSLTQRAMVVGERLWTQQLMVWKPGEPQPFDFLPLLWEHAAGGSDQTPVKEADRSRDPRNPIGCGHVAKRSQRRTNERPIPRIVALDAGEDTPVGFGPIPGDWQPRLGFAGTYDDAWKADRCPLLPDDFDQRYHNLAAPGLIAATPLVGGERLSVWGCTPGGGRLDLDLPTARPVVELDDGRRRERVAMGLASVVISPERLELSLLWRGGCNVHGRFLDLRSCTVASEGRP